MNNEEKDIEFIEKYLEGRLTPEEKTDFDERLIVDEKFKEKFYSYKNLLEGVTFSGRKDLLQGLKKIEASISAQESFDKKIVGLPVRHFYSYSAAATVLLLIAFTFVFLLNHKSSSPELYAEFYTPYQNIIYPTTRGESETKSVRENAFYFYDLKEYHEAIELFEKLKEDNAAEDLLYLGNSYMAINHFDSAISKFNILESIDSPFKTQARWYLALSYLGKNNVGKSMEILEEIKLENNFYSKKAEGILEKLR